MRWTMRVEPCDKVASRLLYLWSRKAASSGRNTGRRADAPNSALEPAVAVRLKPRICGTRPGRMGEMVRPTANSKSRPDEKF